MAAFEVDGIDALIQQMQLEEARIERNGPAAVLAGAEVLRQQLEASAPVRTGGLAGSIRVGKLVKDSINGIHCDVYPDGKDPHGERYATIGSVLEYGRSNMPARPWLRPTAETAGAAVSAAMAAEIMKD